MSRPSGNAADDGIVVGPRGRDTRMPGNPPPVDKAIAEHFAEQRDCFLDGFAKLEQKLERKIDASHAKLRAELLTELDAGLNGVRSDMRLGFKAMEARFETRFDGVEDRLGKLEIRLDGVDQKLDVLVELAKPKATD